MTKNDKPRTGKKSPLIAAIVLMAVLAFTTAAWALTKVVLGDSGLYSSSNRATSFTLGTNGWWATGAYLYANDGYVAARKATAATLYATGHEGIIGVTSTAAVRGIYMPVAATASIPIGYNVTIQDESGGANSNNIILYTLGNNTINGVAYSGAGVAISTAYGGYRVYYGGSNKWFAR